jgi:hypothetical protein
MFRDMKNILCELTEAEQEKVLLWSEEIPVRELAKKIEKAEPEGFGKKIGKTALNTWINAKRAERIKEEAEETKKRAKAMKEQQGDGGELEEGALAVLRQRMFEEAERTGRTGDVTSMYRAMRELIFKEERIALARERAKISREYLELARERFQFNAARVALEYADELQAIAQETEIDDEEKIHRARARLFGKEVVDGMKNPRRAA